MNKEINGILKTNMCLGVYRDELENVCFEIRKRDKNDPVMNYLIEEEKRLSEIIEALKVSSKIYYNEFVEKFNNVHNFEENVESEG